MDWFTWAGWQHPRHLDIGWVVLRSDCFWQICHPLLLCLWVLPCLDSLFNWVLFSSCSEGFFLFQVPKNLALERCHKNVGNLILHYAFSTSFCLVDFTFWLSMWFFPLLLKCTCSPHRLWWAPEVCLNFYPCSLRHHHNSVDTSSCRDCFCTILDGRCYSLSVTKNENSQKKKKQLKWNALDNESLNVVFLW